MRLKYAVNVDRYDSGFQGSKHHYDYQQTCKNFSELARRGYYNGLIFHRIISVSHLLRTVRDLSNLTPHLYSGLHDTNW